MTVQEYPRSHHDPVLPPVDRFASIAHHRRPRASEFPVWRCSAATPLRSSARRRLIMPRIGFRAHRFRTSRGKHPGADIRVRPYEAPHNLRSFLEVDVARRLEQLLTVDLVFTEALQGFAVAAVSKTLLSRKLSQHPGSFVEQRILRSRHDPAHSMRQTTSLASPARRIQHGPANCRRTSHALRWRIRPR